MNMVTDPRGNRESDQPRAPRQREDHFNCYLAVQPCPLSISAPRRIAAYVSLFIIRCGYPSPAEAVAPCLILDCTVLPSEMPGLLDMVRSTQSMMIDCCAPFEKHAS